MRTLSIGVLTKVMVMVMFCLVIRGVQVSVWGGGVGWVERHLVVRRAPNEKQ